MARLIECVWDRFDVGYGGAPKALQVARCESGLRPHASSGTGSEGLFQHMSRYWPSRLHTYIDRHRLRSSWRLNRSIYNGRTNAIVTALMVRRHGWSAWSCA